MGGRRHRSLGRRALQSLGSGGASSSAGSTSVSSVTWCSVTPSTSARPPNRTTVREAPRLRPWRAMTSTGAPGAASPASPTPPYPPRRCGAARPPLRP